MKKIFSFAVLMLIAGVFAGTVYAFTGEHYWYQATAITSDGHTYKGEYQATGTFPIDNILSDNAKVSLKGTMKVTEEDGIPVSKEYCLVLKAHSGQYQVVKYTDITCSTVDVSKTYTLVYHTSNETDNFYVKAYDQAGVTLEIAGLHEYTQTRKN